MRISSSTITMAANRSYSAEAALEQTAITRRYNGDAVQSASASTLTTQIKQVEVEAGTAVFQTSDAGLTRTDSGVVDVAHSSSDSVEHPGGNSGASLPQAVALPNSGNWINSYGSALEEPPETVFLKTLLKLLERFTGKKMSWRDVELPSQKTASAGSAFQVSASTASMRYQETLALVNGNGGQAVFSGSQASAVNGHWTRQTVESGFVAGQEHTAFTSKGTVVTSDGRTLDFNISVELSRSFEAAYVAVGKEEVYTDPLVINLDTNAASLSDVSFYFDLNCDGVAEELSALDSSSGFLALDKNGDGKINNGSELFGAQTGDGFGELAQYDQDGNGWIDESDDVYSQLKVWVKCGSSDAQLLSLDQADVGAIFLGSQNTQYALTDSYGETGAMIRKTGIYLKESGQVGTVQHVDFKA